MWFSKFVDGIDEMSSMRIEKIVIVEIFGVMKDDGRVDREMFALIIFKFGRRFVRSLRSSRRRWYGSGRRRRSIGGNMGRMRKNRGGRSKNRGSRRKNRGRRKSRVRWGIWNRGRRCV